MFIVIYIIYFKLLILWVEKDFLMEFIEVCLYRYFSFKFYRKL